MIQLVYRDTRTTRQVRLESKHPMERYHLSRLRFKAGEGGAGLGSDRVGLLLCGVLCAVVGFRWDWTAREGGLLTWLLVGLLRTPFG